MTARALLIAAVVALAIGLVWRSKLFTVQAPGAAPATLHALPAAERLPADFDAVLAAVPAGSERVLPGRGVLVVHYWAPWERHSGAQVQGLDSLRRVLPPGAVRVAVVCFDPYPSVARYVARLRLRLPVLLDQRRELVDHLPCPSIPYTYVFDRDGRIAIAQAGEVDWLAPGTISAIEGLLDEVSPARPPAPSGRIAS